MLTRALCHVNKRPLLYSNYFMINIILYLLIFGVIKSENENFNFQFKFMLDKER